jgi:hypothetical protein
MTLIPSPEANKLFFHAVERFSSPVNGVEELEWPVYCLPPSDPECTIARLGERGEVQKEVKPWRAIGLSDAKDPTFVDNRLTDGGEVRQPYATAALYAKEYSSYSHAVP